MSEAEFVATIIKHWKLLNTWISPANHKYGLFAEPHGVRKAVIHLDDNELVGVYFGNIFIMNPRDLERISRRLKETMPGEIWNLEKSP